MISSPATSEDATDGSGVIRAARLIAGGLFAACRVQTIGKYRRKWRSCPTPIGRGSVVLLGTLARRPRMYTRRVGNRTRGGVMTEHFRRFEKSGRLQRRAHELVPGGSHTYAKGDDSCAAPGFIERGRALSGRAAFAGCPSAVQLAGHGRTRFAPKPLTGAGGRIRRTDRSEIRGQI